MYAFRVGSAWEVIAPAKLNLYLDVLGARADGFHDLESLMVPVRLYDHLRWRPSIDSDSSGCSLQVGGSHAHAEELVDNTPDNLVLRAAKRLADEAGIEPRGRFQLYKRIPMQAGLGGGSSDAAAALVLANAAWNIDYPTKKLSKLAADIGSDVPFFLAHGPAICRGRGEIVEQIFGLPRLNFVVVKPHASLSTPAVFGQWKRKRDSALDRSSEKNRVQRVVEHLRAGDLYAAGRMMINGLQSAAVILSPIVEQVCRSLSNQGFIASGMSGSGTACWGLTRSARQARTIASRLRNSLDGQVQILQSCSAA